MSAASIHVRAVVHAVAALLLILMAGCAARTPPPPPVVSAPHYPDYVFPAAEGADAGLVSAQDAAWRWLQSGNLRMAERQFAALAKDHPDFVPAQTGLGYAALARNDTGEALKRFGRALQLAEGYAPALVGRGLALVAAGRDAEALASYEAAAAADPTLDLAARIAVLRFRGAGDAATRARTAAEQGHLDEARTAYEQAIAASPESAFLYRELGSVEARAGHTDRALDLYRKAASLDPADARVHVLAGDVLAQAGRDEEAASEYAAAAAIEPAAETQAKLDAARQRAELARLPPEFHAIAGKPEVTRGDVAAMLGVRLAPWLAGAPARTGVLLTDIRGHWAASWILSVVRAGLMEPFPNHTFQPQQRVRRSDLAQIVSRALALAAERRPAATASWRGARQAFPDVPPAHPLWPAISQAVAAGVLHADPDGAFAPSRPASGAELAAAVDRLRQLFGPAPRGTP